MKIRVKVKPGSIEDRVFKDGDVLIVKLKERPVKGKANASLIKILAKEFNVPAKKIKIKNPICREKIIQID
jgi:uncharacterized protein YggU (UPF0235/DUF167 family)